MTKLFFAALTALALAVAVGAQQPPLPPNHPQVPPTQPQTQPPLPPNHPQVQPQLPPGHPQPGLPAGHPAMPTERPEFGDDGKRVPPPAEFADVQSIDAIVKTYYDTISGPKGEPRNWDRFRSLMIPDVKFVTTRPVAEGNMPMVLDLDKFEEVNGTYFERGGYFEREIHRKTDRFGNMAQVFSTYESRRDEREAAPYSRGINSIQLLFDGSRWWIVTVLWDYERLDNNPIPPEYGGRAVAAPAAAGSVGG
ncbi:MAG: hypothetical protein KDA22_13465 [Phycisphaerales bacterium]|nr:hypothetical protein [Phycisphaerales bacterium]